MITQANVINKLATSELFVIGALLTLSDRQTNHEYDAEHTQLKNFQGFNAADATKLTSFVKQIRERLKYTKAIPLLSELQIKRARQRLPKYSRQLAAIANDTQARRYSTILNAHQRRLDATAVGSR